MFRNKHHGFWNRNNVRAAVVVFALGCVSLTATARGYSAGVTPAGATFGVRFGSNGTPLATIGGATGAVVVTQTVPLALPGVAAAVPVLANAAISGAAVAGAWGAAAAVVGTGALMALPSIIEYMKSKNIKVENGSFKVAEPFSCTTAPCYEYRSNDTYVSPTWFSEWSKDALGLAVQACQRMPARKLLNCSTVVVNFTTYNWSVQTTGYDGPYNDSLERRTVAASTSASYLPITVPDAVNLLKSAPGTPGAVTDLTNAGYAPVTAAPVLSGPATVFKGNVVSLGLDGTVKSIEERYNLQYNTSNFGADTGGLSWNTTGTETVTPPVITTSVSVAPPVTLANGNTSVTTTTTKTATPVLPAGSGLVATPVITTTTDVVEKNPSGVVVATGSTSSGTAGKITTPATVPTDKESDLCKLNPDILACAKSADIPTDEIPKSSKTITYAEESVFGSGSCPANLTANISTLRSSVTVWDWQKTCQLSLPLRALVLALASFAAFLIVMPGDTRT